MKRIRRTPQQREAEENYFISLKAKNREMKMYCDRKELSMNDDPFISYLRQNSVLNNNKKLLSIKEKKIGRPRPKYCELHEAMILDPKTIGLPHADHNHENGKYRGWICHNCNTKVLPIIDFMKKEGISSGDIKAFLYLAVDYVFSDGDVLKKRMGLGSDPGKNFEKSRSG